MAVCYSLWSFVIFFTNLECLDQDKSGNPDLVCSFGAANLLFWYVILAKSGNPDLVCSFGATNLLFWYVILAKSGKPALDAFDYIYTTETKFFLQWGVNYNCCMIYTLIS
jgi:hypothetical protein